MPAKSSYPDVEVPDQDLFSFLFKSKKEFPDSQVIYRCALTSRHYTFAEVKRLSIQFGEGLQGKWEFGQGDRLLLYAPNDIDVPPIILGTLFTGGIVTPANPGYSVDELTFQLKNSGARAIVTIPALLSKAVTAARRCEIPLDRILLLGGIRDGEPDAASQQFRHWTQIQRSSHSTPLHPRIINSDQDLAFLVYSSGTTGLPKGVMLSHSNLVAQLQMIRGSLGRWYSPGTDKLLGVLPFFHIYGLTALVLQSLHRGIEQVVMPGFDLRLFCESIQKHRVTYTYIAPPIMVRLARDKLVEEYDLTSLKMATCGAAPLSKELVDIVHKRLGIRACQAYGLSETSPITHGQPWDEWYASVGSVGKLLPNMSMKCMSPNEPPEEVGPDTPGELWVKGPNVFKGYWQNPEATAGCLTTDGYFKTGDVGYYSSSSGDFYITDRVKELIKYKGFQVAPAELEGKLMDHPDILDVAVIGVEDREQHTEVPRAYVVAKHKQKHPQTRNKEEEARIAQWLASKVAGHKRLRGGVRFVDEIPKSATGKILRRVLKDQAKKDDADNRKNGKL